jgi:hypothetical protein
MKTFIIFLIFAFSISAYSQNFSTGTPDSAKNISVPNGLLSYMITNPLGYSSNGFLNSPVAVLTPSNNISNQLYFYDLDLNIPNGATITGIEIIHRHGGCNSGSYTIDSLYLALNGTIISSAKRDSASGFTTNISGSNSDIWSANLNSNIVNDNSFGIILQSNTSGICTFSQSDLQVKVYYVLCNAIDILATPDSAKNLTTPNGQISYVITNPLGHNANGFVNSPVAVLVPTNNISNHLYFYDFDFNLPIGSTITGVEVTHIHGGCNAGSYTIDSLYLAYNGNIISSAKRDSASAFTTNISGGNADLWSANLNSAIVNDNSFGIILQSNTNGICTFSQSDLQIKVFYCNSSTSLENVETNTKLNIYPNPADQKLFIEHSLISNDGTYRVFDIYGRQIMLGKFGENNFNIDISELLPNIYFLQMDGITKKFIKK